MAIHDSIHIHLESSAFAQDEVHLYSLQGRECLGELFVFEVELATLAADALDVAALRGVAVAIVFSRGGDEVARRWGCVVEAADMLDVDVDSRRYMLRIEPRASRMRLVHTQDILMALSWPQAVEEKLGRVALGSEIDLRLVSNYSEREFIVQYNESDLAFVSRLSEHAGIVFFFEHGSEGERMIFSDHNDGFAKQAESVPYRNDLEHDIYALSMHTRWTPAKVAVQDYNYRTPTVELTAFADVEGGHAGGVAEYGAHYKTPAEAAHFAKLRAEEIHCHERSYSGKSNRSDLMPGLRIEVSDHPNLIDTELLLTEVVHEAKQTALGHGSGEQYYRNAFEATVAARPYRPLRLTPKPKMVGFFTGIVQPIDEEFIGPSAQLDDDGRYRVRMCFDIQPRDGNMSRPVRMAQPHSGAGHGMHFPLRPGVEVAVVFANGDPDRPVIVGALDNPATPSPTANKNSRHNILSTASGIKITLRDNR